MKILKRIAIILGALVVVYLVVAMCCSSACHVERSLVINASAKTTYDQVNTLKNWTSWSYWDNIDTAMTLKYEGPEAGVGAKRSWDSKNDSVGNGTMTIVKAEEAKLVETELYFDGMGPNTGGWKFRDTTGGVIVTSYMHMEIPFFFRPMMAMMDMDAMLGADFEKSLAGLKRVSEEKEKASAVPQIAVETMTTNATKMVTIKDSCTLANLNEKLGMIYGELEATIKKGGATITGSPFAIYHDVTYGPDGIPQSFVFEAGFPVDKEIKSSNRVKYAEMPATMAAKTVHNGHPNQSGEVHEKMDKWLKANNKTIVGAPWEVYVVTYPGEADPNKHVTEIYYPVQ